jgi:hypothetical protein
MDDNKERSDDTPTFDIKNSLFAMSEKRGLPLHSFLVITHTTLLYTTLHLQTIPYMDCLPQPPSWLCLCAGTDLFDLAGTAVPLTGPRLSKLTAYSATAAAIALVFHSKASKARLVMLSPAWW